MVAKILIVLIAFCSISINARADEVMNTMEVRGQSAIDLKFGILPGTRFTPDTVHGEFYVEQAKRIAPNAHYFHWRAGDGKGKIQITCVLNFISGRGGRYFAKDPAALEKENVCWIQTLK